MTIDEMKKIAAARTKGEWKAGITYHATQNAEFIAMAANNWDKLMAVVDAANRLILWESISCPACSIENPSPEVPCYCYDYIDAKSSTIEALEALEK